MRVAATTGLDAPRQRRYARAAVPRQSHASIRPRSFTEWDAELDCYVSRIVGYHASCLCGWRSGVRGTFAAARMALRTHRDEADCQKAPRKRSQPV